MSLITARSYVTLALDHALAALGAVLSGSGVRAALAPQMGPYIEVLEPAIE
jgi:hypothetical protein